MLSTSWFQSSGLPVPLGLWELWAGRLYKGIVSWIELGKIVAFDQVVGKSIESSQCEGTELWDGWGKELEMEFITSQSRQVVSWTEQEVAEQLGNEWSVHRESRRKCLRAQRTPSGTRASPECVGGHREVGPGGNGTGALGGWWQGGWRGRKERGISFGLEWSQGSQRKRKMILKLKEPSK